MHTSILEIGGDKVLVKHNNPLIDVSLLTMPFVCDYNSIKSHRAYNKRIIHNANAHLPNLRDYLNKIENLIMLHLGFKLSTMHQSLVYLLNS